MINRYLIVTGHLESNAFVTNRKYAVGIIYYHSIKALGVIKLNQRRMDPFHCNEPNHNQYWCTFHCSCMSLVTIAFDWPTMTMVGYQEGLDAFLSSSGAKYELYKNNSIGRRLSLKRTRISVTLLSSNSTLQCINSDLILSDQ